MEKLLMIFVKIKKAGQRPEWAKNGGKKVPRTRLPTTLNKQQKGQVYCEGEFQ